MRSAAVRNDAHSWHCCQTSSVPGILKWGLCKDATFLDQNGDKFGPHLSSDKVRTCGPERVMTERGISQNCQRAVILSQDCVGLSCNL